MRECGGPAYELGFVRGQMARGRYVLPARVKRHVRARGWDEAFVIECMLVLDASTYHKSIAHHERPGIWLDVYRPCVRGRRMYVKFTLFEDGERLLILSLCVDASAH
jgi:hypothetical protein